MSKCQHCDNELSPQARFCSACGKKAIATTLICPQCGSEMPDNAAFCTACGFDFKIKNKFEELFEAAPFETAEQEIVDGFFQRLRKKITEEQDIGLWNTYLQRFHESEFKAMFELRIKQLAEDLQRIRERNPRAGFEVRQLLAQNFESLTDHFLIHYCVDINPVTLPEVILSYQYAKPEHIDFYKMVMDYLYFEDEPAIVYTNLLEMPREKLRNAGRSYLKPDKKERIFFICDQSVTGSMKEGFSMTDKGLYWKMIMEPPHVILYDNLVSVEREKDWLNINGLFFNAGKNLNIKLLKLLRKIQSWNKDASQL